MYKKRLKDIHVSHHSAIFTIMSFYFLWNSNGIDINDSNSTLVQVLVWTIVDKYLCRHMVSLAGYWANWTGPDALPIGKAQGPSQYKDVALPV